MYWDMMFWRRRYQIVWWGLDRDVREHWAWGTHKWPPPLGRIVETSYCFGPLEFRVWKKDLDLSWSRSDVEDGDA